jgi:acetyl/propionyl-CoA carboxylase alpha subunit
MNTRLQVEHPVTELITGIDLVQEQVKVARGEALSFSQEDLRIDGHAIELRVYAEDPESGFLPDIGKLEVYRRPSGPGVRVDDGFREGMDIPVYYDPMISKLCVHAGTREQAIERMIRAIDEYTIVGIKTTLGFGRFVMEHEAFRSGDFDTGFVKDYYHPNQTNNASSVEHKQVAAILADRLLSELRQDVAVAENGTVSKWRRNRTL